MLTERTVWTACWSASCDGMGWDVLMRTVCVYSDRLQTGSKGQLRKRVMGLLGLRVNAQQ